MDLKAYLQTQKDKIEQALREWLPDPAAYPSVLHRSMHYSLFAGGKRIRPILHLATVDAEGGDQAACTPFACALEVLHTYSLIHDDLPAMDDDDLRRGRPTNHKVFGEAVAILAGDALLTEVFQLVSAPAARSGLDADALLWAIHELAQAAGSQGMVGGQAMDIASEGRTADPDTLHYIHTHKTGALIRAAVRTGAILSRASTGHLDAFTRYGEALGLAFQVRDDLLNVEGDPKHLGKSVGTDAFKGKMTYPGLFGQEQARQHLRELINEALAALRPLNGRAEPLREIARYIAERNE
jgi:geranylgeranyl diphosphate synthase type II